MKKLIFVLIDGLRSDALNRGYSPTLDLLMEKGAFSLEMKTVSPPLTLPAHFSIFTSLAPYAHGVTTNTGLPDTSALSQSFFTHIKSHGGVVSAFYSWDHLRNLAPPGVMDLSFYRKNCNELHLKRLAQEAVRHIVSESPDFCFVYLEWTDLVGHRSGWMSKEYLNAVQEADQAVEQIYSAVLSLSEHSEHNGYNLVIQSDHGGNQKHHFENIPEIINVPFIAWGPDIGKGRHITSSLSVLDTAPTLAKIMEIPCHPAWEGRAVTSLFDDGIYEYEYGQIQRLSHALPVLGR